MRLPTSPHKKRFPGRLVRRLRKAVLTFVLRHDDAREAMTLLMVLTLWNALSQSARSTQ